MRWATTTTTYTHRYYAIYADQRVKLGCIQCDWMALLPYFVSNWHDSHDCTKCSQCNALHLFANLAYDLPGYVFFPLFLLQFLPLIKSRMVSNRLFGHLTFWFWLFVVSIVNNVLCTFHEIENTHQLSIKTTKQNWYTKFTIQPGGVFCLFCVCPKWISWIYRL